jgi:hypothetical protein
MSYQCNICMEDLDEETKCVLDCHPNHIFCKTCIQEWYYITMKKNTFLSIDIFACPICKNFGGFHVLKKCCSIEKYHLFLNSINQRCMTHCLCRIDDVRNPYSTAQFCKKDLSIHHGGTVTFEEDGTIALCNTHYQQFDRKERLYHFFHGIIFQEKSDDDSNNDSKNESSFHWERKEIMSINKSKKCCAKTHLGHRCTRKYSMYYVNKNSGETLFLCTTHEKKLLKDNFIEKLSI